MLHDVVPIVDRLSKSFQVENISLGTVKPKVTGAKLRLTALQDELGETEEKFDHDFTVSSLYKDTALSYSSQQNIAAYKNVRTSFLHDLVTNVENRFPDDDLDVLSAFAIVFDATSYPQLERELRDHGNQALAVLSDLTHFCQQTNCAQLSCSLSTRCAHTDQCLSVSCTLVIKEYQTFQHSPLSQTSPR